jgi:hypothetical protein
MRSLARCSVLVLLLQAATSLAAGLGPVFNVNSVADLPDAAYDGICNTGGICNGVPCCTLRAAVMEANYSGSPYPVTINLPAGTYLLTRAIGSPDDATNGDLDIIGLSGVQIVGAGPDLSIIDANHIDRAIHINTPADVTLSDLRIQGGRPPATANGGGNPRASGAAGGGIYNEGGALTLLRCLVRDNATIAADSGGSGGGINSQGGSLTLTESVVRINTVAPGSNGGGILANGTATKISRSTVNLNSAASGAGIYQYNGSLAIVNSTISQNAASYSGGGFYAIFISNVALNNVTVALNTAGGSYPAGSEAAFDDSTVTFSNSILDNGDLRCNASSLTSNGHNYFGSQGSCTITGAFLDAFYDLNLGPVGLWGGTTVTHPLLAGSAAINAGSPPSMANPFGCYDLDGSPLATDQRGVTRKIGAACDLGAFEVEPIGDANGDGVVNVADVFYLINFLFAGGPVPKGRANVDGVSGITVSDVFYLINFLFAGGQPPV